MILIHTPKPQQVAAYLDLFRAAMPACRFVSQAEADPAAVRYLVAWGVPPGMLSGLPNLEALFVLGAGVDSVLALPDLPPDLPVYRLLDAGMAAQMAGYVRYGVLGYQRNMDLYRRQQDERVWRPRLPRRPEDVRVGILGLGEIGGAVATALVHDGYRVSGWRRSPASLAGVTCLHGTDGLMALLAGSDVLVSLLPSTPDTRGLLDAKRLATLPQGSMFINAGRGDVVDQDALLALLDAGHLRCAQLDVFAEEPLPPAHPLWSHLAVTITPHAAAVTLYDEAVAQVAEGLRVLAAGGEPAGRVRRQAGY